MAEVTNLVFENFLRVNAMYMLQVCGGYWNFSHAYILYMLQVASSSLNGIVERIVNSESFTMRERRHDRDGPRPRPRPRSRISKWESIRVSLAGLLKGRLE